MPGQGRDHWKDKHECQLLTKCTVTVLIFWSHPVYELVPILLDKAELKLYLPRVCPAVRFVLVLQV